MNISLCILIHLVNTIACPFLLQGMLVGKAGNRVERVSALVKQDLESIFNCQVRYFLTGTTPGSTFKTSH